MCGLHMFQTLLPALMLLRFWRLGCGYFFAHLVLTLLSEQQAVLLVLFYLFILHLRQLNEGITRSKKKWLMYWAAYGSFSMVELFTDNLLNWFPLYYHTKFAFLVWLQLPSIDGAKQVYMNHLRPFLLDHQAKLDRIVGFVYGEMVNSLNMHL